MRPIQAYVPKERILPSAEIVKEGQALWDLRVAGGWRLVAGEPRLPLVILV
jgi:hypothetical protein